MRLGRPFGAATAVIAGVAAGAVLLAGQPASGAPRIVTSDHAAAPSASTAAAREIAGIENAGPIPTRSGSGQRVAEVPPTFAAVPGGTALHGDFPSISVRDLADAGSVSVRVYDASRGKGVAVTDSTKDFVWEGTLSGGWGRIGARLEPGHGYVVWVRNDDSGRWVNFGRFGVRGVLDPPGPAVRAGGMSAALATGQVTWTWESESLAGPSAGVRVALQYAAQSPEQPGVPAGWRLMAASGSPWMSIEESGDRVRGHVSPAKPAVERVGTRAAVVDFGYDIRVRDEVDAFVIEQKIKGTWKRIGRAGEDFADPEVDARVRLLDPKAPVRVGLRVDGTTLYSGATTPRRSAPEITTVASETRDLDCGGSLTTSSGPEAVRLEGWNGMSLTFLRNALGVYEQAVGGDKVPGYRNILSMCGDDENRRWLFTDSSGVTTTFKDGRAVKVTDQGRAVATMTWQDERLTSIANAIGRTISLDYASCPQWSGFTAAPSGSLCRITYPGGVQTEFGYTGDKLARPQIALIKDPGNTGTALGWDSVGRLVATRSALANRAATTDASARGVVATVSYDELGRANAVREAPSSPGAEVVVQQIDVPVITEDVLRSGAEVTARVTGTASGYDMANTVRIDPASLDGISFTDRAELTTSTEVDGRRVTTRDARGLVTKVVYDTAGNIVSQSGPASGGAVGTSVDLEYDIVKQGAREEALEGFRATEFAGSGFTGAARPDHWEPGAGGGFTGEWDATTRSALAQAIWTPTEEDDKRARDEGWTFEIDRSGGADVHLVIEGRVCEGTTCTFDDLPSGAKQVSVEVDGPDTGGWFVIKAGIGSERPQAVPAAQVRPGFNNRSSSTTNDTFSTSVSAPTVDYAYAAPETGKVTSVEMPGGYTSSLAYETSGWGRLTTYTTPGGKVQTTEYWPASGSASLPGVCRGTAVASGLPRTVTRQDGSSVETYFDIRGRQLAVVTTGRSTRETACREYADDGRLTRSATYDGSGALIEEVIEEIGIGGNPLAVRQTLTHGPAAPVDPGVAVTTESTLDLSGRPVRYVDESGTTTVTTYTAFGEPATIAITPSGASAPLLTFAYAYRSTDAAPIEVSVNGVTAAEVDYAPGAASVRSVSYFGDVTAGLAYGPSGRPSSITVVGDGARYEQSQTMTDFGRILGQDTLASVGGKLVVDEQRGYVYDVAGRLASAAIVNAEGPATRYTYDYAGRQDASCGSAYPGAGADTLRTGGERNGMAYVTCYDDRGRIVSTTDPLLAASGGKATFAYDDLGRVTTVEGRTDLALSWGAGTTLARVVDGPTTTSMSTFAGRIVSKEIRTGALTDRLRYSYATPQSNAPIMLLDDSGIAAVEYALPGGARVRADAGEVPTIALTGIDGSALAIMDLPAAAVAGVSGAASSGRAGTPERFGPYGEVLGARPNLLDASPCYTWQAAQRHETLGGDAAITLMGARPYLPATGLFLAPDPDLDASTGIYSYAAGDPINGTDRTGAANEWSWFWMVITAVLVVVTIVVDVVTLGMAAPATGAGIGAWAAYIGLTWGVPIALGMLAGKALEQSVLSQTEPSDGLDVFRSVMGWTQMISGLAMLGIPLVKWVGRKAMAVHAWWRSRPAPTMGGANLGADLADDVAGSALMAPRRSIALPQTQRLSVDALSNGGRDILSSNAGRLSVGAQLDGIDVRRVASYRSNSILSMEFSP
jgi:RHS repeat-associated protein